jgi:hypothetical protein
MYMWTANRALQSKAMWFSDVGATTKPHRDCSSELGSSMSSDLNTFSPSYFVFIFLFHGNKLRQISCGGSYQATNFIAENW